MITREDFEDYERVRLSGRTNMFDINAVVLLSDFLNKEKCFEIMDNYSELKQKFSKDKEIESNSEVEE